MKGQNLAEKNLQQQKSCVKKILNFANLSKKDKIKNLKF